MAADDFDFGWADPVLFGSEVPPEAELFDVPEDPGTAELRDPGLYPDVMLFVANLGSFSDYLSFAPGRINALLSAYDIVTRNCSRQVMANVRHARSVFLDSGCISAMIACASGKLDRDFVQAWTRRTPELVALSFQLHDAGAPPGVIAALDMPAYADLLTACGFTVHEAEDLTIHNAVLMRDTDIPAGWRRVFTSQGLTLEDHERMLDRYESIGVLDDIRAGRAWLGVGGMAFEGADTRVHTIHGYIRDRVGPDGHIHVLGVRRPTTLVPMLRRGWVNSADSSSPVLEIRFNRGRYQTAGPRPAILHYVLHAVNSLFHEAELAAALERARRTPDYVQSELFT